MAGIRCRNFQVGPCSSAAAGNGLLAHAGQCWSLDFVSGAFNDGRRFRVLVIVHDFSRGCLALVADTSLSGLRVTRELSAIKARRDRPRTVVSENGKELSGMVMLR
ncbi:transposase [Notoacmeibacter ruber]|uniref:Transposase n=1 Tax=Notoacmeibacter ruber TaxID=2670375 RepID=A0A3L7J2Z0_9HYPH|nr:transposase [Notoacmeibacter ruber]